MATLHIEGEMVAHVAGALHDYIRKLREHQQSTPSAAEKASYARTIAAVEQIIRDLQAQV